MSTTYQEKLNKYRAKNAIKIQGPGMYPSEGFNKLKTQLTRQSEPSSFEQQNFLEPKQSQKGLANKLYISDIPQLSDQYISSMFCQSPGRSVINLNVLTSQLCLQQRQYQGNRYLNPLNAKAGLTRKAMNCSSNKSLISSVNSPNDKYSHMHSICPLLLSENQDQSFHYNNGKQIETVLNMVRDQYLHMQHAIIKDLEEMKSFMMSFVQNIVFQITAKFKEQTNIVIEARDKQIEETNVNIIEDGITRHTPQRIVPTKNQSDSQLHTRKRQNKSLRKSNASHLNSNTHSPTKLPNQQEITKVLQETIKVCQKLRQSLKSARMKQTQTESQNRILKTKLTEVQSQYLTLPKSLKDQTNNKAQLALEDFRRKSPGNRIQNKRFSNVWDWQTPSDYSIYNSHNQQIYTLVEQRQLGTTYQIPSVSIQPSLIKVQDILQEQSWKTRTEHLGLKSQNRFQNHYRKGQNLDILLRKNSNDPQADKFDQNKRLKSSSPVRCSSRADRIKNVQLRFEEPKLLESIYVGNRVTGIDKNKPPLYLPQKGCEQRMMRSSKESEAFSKSQSIEKRTLLSNGPIQRLTTNLSQSYHFALYQCGNKLRSSQDSFKDSPDHRRVNKTDINKIKEKIQKLKVQIGSQQ